MIVSVRTSNCHLLPNGSERKLTHNRYSMIAVSGAYAGEFKHDSYLGPSFSDEEIGTILDRRGLKYQWHESIEMLTAKLIAKGYIVSWFQGNMEWGPRALGNRSILADPRTKDMVAELNHKVKHREPFRPFCPSVLDKRVKEWFVCNGVTNPGQYMLVAWEVLPDKKDLIPAVIHIDGTSRIHIVDKDLNPKYYRLIEAFEDLTDVPVVLNTSFNDSEPITCNPEDAVNTFLKTNIDYLVMGNFVISKEANRLSVKVPDMLLEQYFERLR